VKRGLIAALLLALLGTALGETRMMVVTDIHYMAPSLYVGSGLFLRALRAGDGKYTQQSDALMEALCAAIRAESPDALIVTGDLSFDGERASHEALAGYFARIEAAGVPVWVLPGNHDINVTTARGFRGEEWYATDPVTPSEFSVIYADFMRPSEGANLSYTAEVSDALWVPMVDAAFYEGGAQSFGVFLSAHREWLESVAARAGARTLVTASHHNLLAQTEFAKETFVMLGGDALLQFDRDHGVRLHLSGHIHAQHIVEEGGVTDAATGAFCTWPHRYGVVTLSDDGALTYAARALEAEMLPEGFLEESRAWTEAIHRDKTAAYLENIPERDAMADYAARFNLAYFAGTYRPDDPAWREDAAYALWRSHADNPFWRYLGMVMEEPAGDNLRRVLPAG